MTPRNDEPIAVKRLFGIDFLDVPSIGEVTEKLLHDVDQPSASWRSVVTPNVDHLVRYTRHPEERRAGEAAYVALADGMPIVWASRLLRRPLACRLTGTDLFADLWPRLVAQGRRVLLVVGSDQVASRLAAEHPMATFVVPKQFDVEDRVALDVVVDEIIDRITAVPVDFVILGVSMPKNHRLGLLLSERPVPVSRAPIVLLLGAAAEFHVGFQQRAPGWMRRSGLEWVHRLIRRPGYMAKRYLVDDMKFLQLVWREWRNPVSTPSFSVRPTSFAPISALAYCCTRLGPRLQRRFGKYGFNLQARLLNADRFHPTIRAVAEDCAFEFPALDQYFAEMFVGGGYEKELYTVLRVPREAGLLPHRRRRQLGYWSVLASGAQLGHQQAIAVEASPQTFSLLQRNVGLNGNRIVAVHAAVHERSGDVLAFDDASEHAARKVVANQALSTLPSTVVVSVAIDDLAARFAPDARAFVVKLDVEGTELAALSGASRVLQDCDVVLLVEDHGSDRSHAVTTYLLDHGFVVHFLQPEAEPIQIVRPSQLDVLKSDVNRGYNISGHRGSSALAAAAGLANHDHTRDGDG